MNWIVITIGTALVLALFTALIGPYFVDWTAYRATIEANAERFLGTRVAIDGEAELRLLPSPRIRLTDVRLGGEDAPIVTARSVELDVELTPLLRREFHVRQLRVDAPVATVTIEPDGTLAVPDITIDRRFTSIFAIENVMVADIEVSDGVLRIRDRRNGADTAVTDIALAGEVRSLRGPFTATGTMRLAGVDQAVQLSGGRLESGTMPVSLRLAPEGRDVSLSFEGAAVPRPDALAMRGTLAVTGTGRPAWSLRGDLRANPTAVTLSRGTVRYGAGDAAVELNAEGRYAIAETDPLRLSLAARQLDVDRLERALRAQAAAVDTPGATVTSRPPRAFVDALADHVAPALQALGGRGGFDVPVAAEIDIGTLVAGGGLIRDLSAAFAASGGDVRLERAEALLPGDTAVELSGRFGDTFTGRVNLSAAQPAVLGRWWSGSTVAGGAIGPVFADADIEVGDSVVEAPRLSVRIGESSASGRARYGAGAGAPPQLDLALAAPRLDLDDLADLWAVLGAAGWQPAATPDMRIDLNADEVLFGGTQGAALSLDADFREGTLTIDALTAQDVAGAQLFASGAIGDLFGTPVGAIEGSLAIDDGLRLGAALAGLDSTVAADLAAAVPALAPADARFRISGGTGAEADGLSIGVSGTAGGTTVELDAALMPGPGWREAPARLTLSAQNPDSARLLAQLGFPTRDGQPAGRLDLSFEGTPASGMNGTAEVALLGLDGRFDGAVRFADGIAPDGTLSLEADSLGPLGDALGGDLPQIAPLRLSGTLSSEDSGLQLDALQGTAAGVDVSGALATSDAGLAGALDVATLDLGAIAALLLGTDPLAEGEDGRRFANTVFPVPVADVLPPLTVELATPALRFGAADLGAATLGVSLDADTLTVSDLGARLGEGTLTGDLALVREGARVDLSGSLSLDEAAIGALAWRTDGAPVATGTLSAEGTFSGSGYTMSGLVAGLDGEGRFSLADVRIEGLDPAPLDLADEAFTGEDPPREAAVRDVFADHLASGSLTVERAEGVLGLSGGTLRLGETALSAPAGTASAVNASAAVDLVNGTLTSGWTLAFVPQGADQPVAVGLSFAGSLAAPERSIDVAALTAYLSLRHLEAQVQAVEQQNEALEAEANRLAPELPAPPQPGDPDASANDAGDLPPLDPLRGNNGAAPDGAPPPVPAPPPRDANDAALDSPGRPGFAAAQPDDTRPSVREELLRSRGIDPAQTTRTRLLELAPSP